MLILGTDDSDGIQDRIRRDDFIFGFAGDDRLEDDLRMGGTPPSDDFFFGGAGNDSIYSIYGDDVLNGQRGNDELDVVFDTERRVEVNGGKGFDSLTLWGFNEDRVTIKIHEQRTVVEQGDCRVVIDNSVEEWSFY